ncbi:MAG: cobyric acid synthase [Limibacillus sp.]
MSGALMLQGTGSDVGKSLLVAGLCRAARNRGVSVAPFKPQNMSNNAAVCPGGGEIGRAQWLQALAAGRAPSVDMNPVLLKPHSDIGAQIVLRGEVWGEADARDYQSRRALLLEAVLESHARLRAQADLVIVEGAGSPAEINLRQADIANMGFARPAGVPVVLVGDIDRGGVIASLVGTHSVLEEADRTQVRGFLINKFRGDVSLFDEGLKEIERRSGWRSFGVVPWLPVVTRLPAEDAVVLDRPAAGEGGSFKVAAPLLSRIANFDDLDPLRQEPGVTVEFVPPGKAIPGDADLVVLLGTKATIADLAFLKAQGWDLDIRAHLRRGGRLLGLCGGFQMLGRAVHDPKGIEGLERHALGLGLLDLETWIEPEKVTATLDARDALSGARVTGYEIHAGRSSGPALARPFLKLEGRDEGAVSADGRIAGAYLHGLFTSDAYRRSYLESLGVTGGSFAYGESLESALDELAEALERVLDIDGLLALAVEAASV